MATRKSARRSGRALVAIGLGAFIVVATIVVFRRSEGTRIAREMRTLQSQQRDLLNRKVLANTRLRGATSRATVIREAERRLGMHVATEAQARSLPTSGER